MSSFAVLNPGGRDPEQLFPNGAGLPTDPGHPPVNFHAYAACLNGGFYRDVRRLPKPAGAVLILIRQRIGLAVDALRAARKAGWKVWVTFKETGAHQLAEFLNDAKRMETLRQLCAEADGCLAATPETAALFQAFGATNVSFVPTPYPVDVPAWNFAQLDSERRGIWIGTREFDVPSRNHATAIALALSTGESVSVMVTDARSRRKALALGAVNVIEGPLNYAEYLRKMAAHRVVFQLDSSRVPGQVAGDALLTRTPCVGGDGAVESMAFPETNGIGKSHWQLLGILQQACVNDSEFDQIRQLVDERAQSCLSFAVGRTALLAVLAGGQPR